MIKWCYFLILGRLNRLQSWKSSTKQGCKVICLLVNFPLSVPLSTLIWLTPASLLKGHFLREALLDLSAIKSTLYFLSQSTITLVSSYLPINSVRQISCLYWFTHASHSYQSSSTLTKTNIVWMMNEKQCRDVKVCCASPISFHKQP